MITYMYTAKLPTQLNVSLDMYIPYMYLRTETHFQVVSRQAQAQAQVQVQGNKQTKKGNPLLTTFVRE